MADQLKTVEQRVFGGAIQSEIVLSDQLQRAKHPHRILLETQLRIADRTDDPGADIANPLPGVVDQLGPDGIVKQSVDGEIAPPCILLRRSEFIVGEDHVFRQVLRRPAVRAQLPLRRRLAEGAHFKDAAHLLRSRGSGNIVVFRRAAEQQVADRPADDICFKTGVLKLGNQTDDMVCNR